MKSLIAVLWSWEGSVFDRPCVGGESAADPVVAFLQEVLYEFWYLDVRRRDAKQVMHHHNLRVDVLSRTDSDDRNAQTLRDAFGELLGYCFQQQQAGAGLLEIHGLFDHGLCLSGIAPLHAESSEAIDGLRRQSHVRTNRNATLDEQAG